MVKNEYYSEEVHGKHEEFDLGAFNLEMGETLRNAKLLYKTHGKLNAKKDNVILYGIHTSFFRDIPNNTIEMT